MATDHRFLQYQTSTPPRRATQLSLQLANYYAKVNLSRNGWKKEAPRTCHWRLTEKSSTGDGTVVATSRTSAPFTADTIRKEMVASRSFDAAKHVLPTPMCPWLDDNIDFSSESHYTDHLGDTVKLRALTPLGAQFPLAPLLDREGAAYTSFQRILIQTILETRDWLVEHSDQFSGISWFEKLRTVIGESVSLVENTLHQLYYKAKYAPLPGWTFDESNLAKRHASRVMDKLRWVRAITGREFNRRDGTAALMRIKSIRNHLEHFDPPVFAYTMEDVAGWLNDVQHVADLVWQVRVCAGVLPSLDLIKLLLSPEVSFEGKTLGARRSPQDPSAGYASVNEVALQQQRHWSDNASRGSMTIHTVRREEVL